MRISGNDKINKKGVNGYMALTNENGGIPATMLVGPTSGMPYFAGGQNGSGGFENGNGWWILLLFIILFASGNWGNNGGGFMNYPIDGGGSVQRGFDQAAVMGGFNNLTAGLTSIQTALCSGFAGVNAAVNSGVNTLAQQMYANQIANMQDSFAMQQAFANCCCENRLGIANLNSTILAENCADRAALSDGIKDLLVAYNAGVQSIKDQMCADKMAQKDDLIAQLRSELMYSRGQASQDVQTAAIQAGQRALANEVEQYVLPTPRPAYIVQNPNCCTPNVCGCGGF